MFSVAFVVKAFVYLGLIEYYALCIFKVACIYYVCRAYRGPICVE